MRAIVAAAALMVLSCGACSSPDKSKLTIATSGDLGLAINFSPHPPTAGIEILTIGVHDMANKPVNGAIVDVNSSMGAMSMNGHSAIARPKGNGVYTAAVEVGPPGRWVFDITAKVGDHTGKARVAIDVI